jgi:hypothetical protein
MYMPLFTKMPRIRILGNSVNRVGSGFLDVASIFLIFLVSPPPARPAPKSLPRYRIYEACEEAKIRLITGAAGGEFDKDQRSGLEGVIARQCE